MYIEASFPRRINDNAKMSRTVSLSGKSCLRFYYHMFGSSMGTVKVMLGNKKIFETLETKEMTGTCSKVVLQDQGRKK